MNTAYKILSRGYITLFALSFVPLLLFWLITGSAVLILPLTALSQIDIKSFAVSMLYIILWWGISGHALASIAQVSISASFNFLNIKQVKHKHHFGILAGSATYSVLFITVSDSYMSWWNLFLVMPLACVVLLYILLLVNHRHYSGHYDGEYHLTRTQKEVNRGI